MKKFYWPVIILVFALSCKQKERSFNRIYLVESSYSMARLPDGFEGFLPLNIVSFLKIDGNGSAINGNRVSNNDTTMVFHNIILSNTLLDSLDLITNKFNLDTNLFKVDAGMLYDGYSYSFFIEKKNKNVLVEMNPYALPIDIRSLFSTLLNKAHTTNNNRTSQPDFFAFQKSFDALLKERSKLLPPKIKTIIKFLPPKVDSASAKK